MTTLLKRWSDRLLGRGDASVTTPIFDGALKPNQLLESSQVVAGFDAAMDMATDGVNLFVADGERVLRIELDGRVVQVATAGGPISALAALPQGRFAVAVGGREICILEGSNVITSWRDAAGKPFRSVNALSAAPDGRLLATEGSTVHDGEDWQRDLLSHGDSGRVLALDIGAAELREIASGLQGPFGVVAGEKATLYSESWRHRVVDIHSGRPATVMDNLPGYPSRIAPAAGGGYWLTAFAARTQLIEFVLRERVLRRRMLDEIDPRYWIAPAFSSGNNFLEPLQGGGVKQMGVLKPWAPPRSYGLVVRLDAQGLPLYSLHSRVGGVHHGIVAAAECHGRLYALSRGSGSLLALELSELSGEFQ
jgi:sugar lactone lactonase YvrE